MAKIEDTQGTLDPVPNVRVLGHMDDSLAVQLGWAHGVVIISQSRMKFLRDELDIKVIDVPKDYLF